MTSLPLVTNGNGYSKCGGGDDPKEEAATVHQRKRRTVKEWWLKYFLQGQKLDGLAEAQVLGLPPDAPLDQRLLVRHRKVVAFLIPFVIGHVSLTHLPIYQQYSILTL